MGRPIKQTVSNYKKLCDGLFSKYIRREGKCDRCGRAEGKLDCAHVVSRNHKGLRWNPVNALPLCFQCHIMWWHKEPLEATKWFEEKYPREWEYLQKEKNKIVKRTLSDYQELYEQLKSL